MRDFLLSIIMALSLWPVYSLLYAGLCWRYGHVAVATCVVVESRTLLRVRLLLTVIALPVFWYLTTHNRGAHWLAFFYLLILLSLADIHLRLLPDYLLALLLIIGVFVPVVGTTQLPSLHEALPALLGTTMIALLCRAGQRWRGGAPPLAGGDLKLIAVLAVWFCYKQWLMVLLVASFAALVYILIIRCMTGKYMRAIAFGPCLALGALAAYGMSGDVQTSVICTI